MTLFTLKNVAAVVVAAHGVGFTLWFLPSWMGTKVGPGNRWIFSDLSISSPMAKAFGLIALLLVAGFLATPWGIFTGATWWPRIGLVSAVAAMALVIPWWNIVSPTSAFGATVVNAVVIVAAIISSTGPQFWQRA